MLQCLHETFSGERMRVIPVLDMKGGIVIRGIAGRRAEYRPLVSQLTDSCQPAAVAQALGNRLGLYEMYLADLDAIAGAPPARDIYASLQLLGCRLWVDAGVGTAQDAVQMAATGIARIVIGLETVAGPHELEEACRT